MSDFLRRWSARKAKATQSPAEEPAAAAELDQNVASGGDAAGAASARLAPGHADGAAAAAPDALDEAEVAARLASLPEVDEIGPGTDIKPFLQAFVPAALRRAALRKAWSVDPVISTHLDAARDYAWDFNAEVLPTGFARGLGSDTLRRGMEALQQSAAEAPAAHEVAAPEHVPAPEAVPPADMSAGQDASPEPQARPAAERPDPPRRRSLTDAALRHGAALPQAGDATPGKVDC